MATSSDVVYCQVDGLRKSGHESFSCKEDVSDRQFMSRLPAFMRLTGPIGNSNFNTVELCRVPDSTSEFASCVHIPGTDIRTAPG